MLTVGYLWLVSIDQLHDHAATGSSASSRAEPVVSIAKIEKRSKPSLLGTLGLLSVASVELGHFDKSDYYLVIFIVCLCLFVCLFACIESLVCIVLLCAGSVS